MSRAFELRGPHCWNLLLFVGSSDHLKSRAAPDSMPDVSNNKSKLFAGAAEWFYGMEIIAKGRL